MDSHLNVRFRAWLLVIPAAALLTVACDSGPVEPVGRNDFELTGGTDGGGVPSSSVDVEGSWQRTVRQLDEFGFVNTTETTWTFEPTGSALQTIVQSNVTLGIADTAVIVGQWRVEQTKTVLTPMPPGTPTPVESIVVVDFLNPPGQVRMAAVVGPQGNVLFLGGQEFLRVE